MSKKIFKVVLLIFWAVFPAKNFAQVKPSIQLPTVSEPEFSVSPSLIELSLSPGEKKTAIITAHNMQAVEKTIRIYGTAFIGDRTDASRFSQEPEEIAKSIIPYCKFPAQLSMKGSDKSVNKKGNPVEVEIIIPKTAKAGEYYGTLIFEQAQKTQQTAPTAQIKMSIGVILFITVKGDTKKVAEITNISVSLPKINATILNKGNVHLKIKQGIARVRNLRNGQTFEIPVIPPNQMPITTYIFPGRERTFEGVIPKSNFLPAGEYAVEFCFDYQGQIKARKIQQFNVSEEEAQTIWGKIPLIEVNPIGLELTIPVNGKISKAITIKNYRQDEVAVEVFAEEKWIEVKQINFTLRGEAVKQIMIIVSNSSEEAKEGRIIFNASAGEDKEQKIIIIKVKKPERKGVKKNAKIFNLFDNHSFDIRVRGA